MDVAEILKFGTLAYLFGVGFWFATAQAKFARASKARPTLFLMIGFSLAATAATLIETIPAPVPLARTLVALVIVTAAVVLIKWAFRSIRQRELGLAFSGIVPDEVVQHGPYRYVRHPLYLAYSIFWVDCVVISASIVTAIFSAVVILLYVLAARAEERDLTNSDLGPVYTAYRKRTGLILPRFTR